MVFTKIGESSFSEVFKAAGSGSDPQESAVKIMPLLRPGEAPSDAAKMTPEPVQLAHLLHEIRSMLALESLRPARKYAVPSGHTGFSRLVQ